MKSSKSESSKPLVAPPEHWFSTLIPFHLVIDEQTRVLQAGVLAQRFLPEGWHLRPLLEIAIIERPMKADLDLARLAERKRKTVWIIRLENGLRLRGDWQISDGLGYFIASPWISSMEEMQALGIKITDLPVHETAGDHLLLLQQARASMNDLRQMAADLTTARDAANAASRAKTAFLATMSHEIRTPMNGVIGSMELLLDSTLTEEQRDLALAVNDSADRLLHIINDILDFSKVEAGELSLAPVSADVRAEISQCVASLMPVATKKGVTVDVETSAAVPERLLLDPVRFSQIFLNLLSNAVKFTDDGGRVDVGLSVENHSAGDEMLRLDVQDSGRGISNEQIEQVFEPFKQAGSPGTSGVQGTGLGLAICRRLAGLMGGSLDVESTPGVGSCFSFVCPLVEASKPESTVSEESVEQFHGRVLIVDDNELNLKIGSRMLERLGLTVVAANDGEEAVRLATGQNERFDVIFMDCQMPGKDGFQATRDIREADERTPIFALTANVLAETRDECLQSGMNGVLCKPIRQEDFRSTLSTLLAGR